MTFLKEQSSVALSVRLWPVAKIASTHISFVLLSRSKQAGLRLNLILVRLGLRRFLQHPGHWNTDDSTIVLLLKPSIEWNSSVRSADLR
ncbi:MAG: hypothetical protein AAFN77_22630 [Planctomycetota bacterium]